MTRTHRPVFKVGDRVRATRTSWGDKYAPIGAVGTVGWGPNFPTVLPVVFDGYPGDGGYGWAMFDYQVEHVHGPLVRALRRAARTLRSRHEAPATARV